MLLPSLFSISFRDEEGKLLGDPTNIVMVSGKYRDTGTLTGQVIHDIMTKEPQNILIPEIKKPFTYLKETEEGKRDMTQALEELVDKGREQGREEGTRDAIERITRNMSAAGLPVGQIVELTGASVDEVRKIVNHIAADS